MPGEAITLEGFAWQIHFHPEDLKDLCQRITEEYRTWYKPKSGGGRRRITTCFGKLRAVQQRILDLYLRDIAWPEYIFGIGNGRGAIRNAKAHQGKHHHFLTDVLEFYPRTESRIVHAVFTDYFGFTPRAASVATRLTTLRGGLPQGTHPSTHLAYLAFREIDQELHEYAEHHGITYTRYGDDLSFSAQQSFRPKVDDIMEIVEGSNTRYNLHQGEKTYYKQGPVEITGVRVLNNKIEVPDRFRKKLERLNPSSAQWQSLKRQMDRIEQL